MTATDAPSFVADLTNCEREPIHVPGKIQAHGYLLAVDPADYRIVQVSENVNVLTGQPALSLIDQSIDVLNQQLGLPSQTLTELLNTSLGGNQSVASPNPYRLTLNGDMWFVLMHQHDGAIILELEPAGENIDPFALQASMAQALAEVQNSRPLPVMLQNAAQKVQEITGYDRVMVYRFHEDWHGEVVAEVHADGLEPFLGLHYPASDIPAQARALYKVNLIRTITDVNQPTAAILPVLYTNRNRPLDLTHAGLRAVSPIHIEYLQNMGVAATLNISLLYRGELWGLISCHHYSPRFIDYATRQSVKLVGQLLSAALTFVKTDEDDDYARQIRHNEQTLYERMLRLWNVTEGLAQPDLNVLHVNSATGAVLMFDGLTHRFGNTPTDEQLVGITDWMRTTGVETFVQTAQLPHLHQPAQHYSDVASGLLGIVLSREMSEYVLWFKPEQRTAVTWGGDPNKPVSVEDDGAVRLSPRKSFAAWTEQTRHRAEPWREVELAVALKLREDIRHVVNQRANEIRALHERLHAAYDELDTFSYTVSHDLRTPLSSIRSYAEIIQEEYGSELNEDANALIDKIVNGSKRMNLLIHNLMHYARMGRINLDLERLNMARLLQTIREEVLTTEPNRALTIEVGELPDVMGDATLIGQVFLNLLTNAAKYSRPMPQPLILVRGIENENDVVFTVQDNGIGIDMRQADKVFELFNRLDNAKPFEGSGIGLTIVKRIVERHKGRVWFDSEPGRGTTFYVALPKQND